MWISLAPILLIDGGPHLSHSRLQPVLFIHQTPLSSASSHTSPLRFTQELPIPRRSFSNTCLRGVEIGVCTLREESDSCEMWRIDCG